VNFSASDDAGAAPRKSEIEVARFSDFRKKGRIQAVVPNEISDLRKIRAGQLRPHKPWRRHARPEVLSAPSGALADASFAGIVGSVSRAAARRSSETRRESSRLLVFP
jgi:hypothetical protein